MSNGQDSGMWGLAAVLLISAALPLLVYAANATAPPAQVSLPVRVVAVHDGDTLTCEVRFECQTRLLDCWAPELSEPGGDKARKRLAALAEGRAATLQIPLENKKNVADIFTFGRVLGRVWVDGRDVGAALVDERLATKEKGGE